MVDAARDYKGNAAPTVLAADISAGATVFTVLSGGGTNYPDGTAGKFFVSIDRGQAGEEKILCTSRSADTFTVDTRGADDTPVSSHTAGSVVEHVFTATDARETRAHMRATSAVHGRTGSLVGTSDTQTLTNKTLTGARLNAGTGDRLHLDTTADVTLASTDHALTLGNVAGDNLALDGNEIQARNNGTGDNLTLNNDGGDVNIGSTAVGGNLNMRNAGSQIIAGGMTPHSQQQTQTNYATGTSYSDAGWDSLTGGSPPVSGHGSVKFGQYASARVPLSGRYLIIASVELSATNTGGSSAVNGYFSYDIAETDTSVGGAIPVQVHAASDSYRVKVAGPNAKTVTRTDFWTGTPGRLLTVTGNARVSVSSDAYATVSNPFFLVVPLP